MVETEDLTRSGVDSGQGAPAAPLRTTLVTLLRSRARGLPEPWL